MFLRTKNTNKNACISYKIQLWKKKSQEHEIQEHDMHLDLPQFASQSKLLYISGEQCFHKYLKISNLSGSIWVLMHVPGMTTKKQIKKELLVSDSLNELDILKQINTNKALKCYHNLAL